MEKCLLIRQRNNIAQALPVMPSSGCSEKIYQSPIMHTYEGTFWKEIWKNVEQASLRKYLEDIFRKISGRNI
jgi:hypothetical protein